MNRTISYLCIIIFAIIPISQTATPLAGPFDVVLKRAGNCPNVAIPKNGFTFESKIVKHTRKYSTLTANLTLGVTLSDDIKSVVTLSRMSNQGWKDNFLIIDAGAACTSAKRFIPTLAKDFLRSVNRSDCPIPPDFQDFLSGRPSGGSHILFKHFQACLGVVHLRTISPPVPVPDVERQPLIYGPNTH